MVRLLKQRSDYILVQEVIQGIKAVMDGKEKEFSSDYVGNEELAQCLNEYARYIKMQSSQDVLENNMVLRKLTQLDELRDTIKEVTLQDESILNITSGSEELASSIDNMTNVIIETTNYTSQAEEQVEKGQQNMRQSMEFVGGAFHEISQVTEEVKLVEQKVKEINKIVDVVKGIAKQTNLLSLNASIEAARAGVQGKGFSIVASEIKKLADHTRESADVIQGNIIELQYLTKGSVNRLDQTNAKLDEGEGLLRLTVEQSSQAMKMIHSIHESMVEVSAITEEGNSATQLLVEEIERASDQSREIREKCLLTGKEIFEISKYVEQVRANVLMKEVSLSQSEYIEIYKVDHLLWCWKVYNVLFGFAEPDINGAGNHKECRLGKWYYSVQGSDLGKQDAFIQLEKPHICLHQDAKEGMIAYQNGDMEMAEKKLMSMGKHSEQVIRLLDEVKRLL